MKEKGTIFKVKCLMCLYGSSYIEHIRLSKEREEKGKVEENTFMYVITLVVLVISEKYSCYCNACSCSYLYLFSFTSLPFEW